MFCGYTPYFIVNPVSYPLRDILVEAESHNIPRSIDWFKERIAGTSHISWDNLWFPVDFP